MKTKFIQHGALALCIGLAASAPSAHAQFSKISEQEEIQAGRQSAAQAVKEYGRALPQSDPRARRVARIGAMFAAQSTRKNIPFSYTVLENDKVLNAFAAPGGPVFVTTKLISTTANDAELAYVLGHETGHIEHKHIVTAIAKQQKVGLIAGILGSVLSRGRAGSAIGAATNITYTLWQKGFSRKEESDADNYGVHAMARLGFDPRAAVSMLGKLGDGPEGVAKYLSDHPTSPQRQNTVTKIIRDDNLLDVAQQAGGARLTLTGNGNESVYGAGNLGSGSSSTPSQDEGSQGSGDTIRLNAPLRLVNSGDARVVLVSVAELARYAGGQARSDSPNSVTVSRGNDYLRLQPGSTRATLNGRQVQLSAAPRVIEGRFYAPLGSVAAGLGGSASYDQGRNAVRVDFDGRGGFLDLP